MALFALAAFFGAFLLFQVQPMLGKFILPWFGGTPAVWTTCMLFFQTALLLGYAYAHALAAWLKPNRQVMIHSVLLGATLLLLPVAPDASLKPMEDSLPIPRILWILLTTVGGPYMLLASTAPLLQHWYARFSSQRSPYRLYAFSNAGSLLGLLTYPLVAERMFRLTNQAWIWSALYAVFAVVCVLCAWRAARTGGASSPDGVTDATSSSPVAPPDDFASPTFVDMTLWLMLSGCGSIMLLATTNLMCEDVASVPFLWVLPLSLYLVTFIVCFDSDGWYRRDIFSMALIAAVTMAVVLKVGPRVGLFGQVAMYCLILTACCFVCHGELVKLKPAPRYATRFYLFIALGGALGGVLATIVAPLLFVDYYEYDVSLIATLLLLLVVVRREKMRAATVALRGQMLRRTLWSGVSIVVAIAVIRGFVVGFLPSDDEAKLIVAERNFYGTVKIIEEDRQQAQLSRIVMKHGSTTHGLQYELPKSKSLPTTYYVPDSGVGIAVRYHPRYQQQGTPLRMGVVGLGTGTLSTYTRPNDYLRYYEIDPKIKHLSDQYFSFQREARERAADVDVYLGDARIVMERQLARNQRQQFDVLVVDAFSSSAIPVHLLTAECVQLYWAHMKSDGILAVHVSNAYVDLAPVVRGLGDIVQRQAYYFRLPTLPAKPDEAPSFGSDWILITNNEPFLATAMSLATYVPWSVDVAAPVLWTDDFSNLFQVLRLRRLKSVFHHTN